MKRWLDSHQARMQRADGHAAARLLELRVDERRDDAIGQVGAHQRAHGGRRGVLGLRRRPGPDEPLREAHDRPHRDGRRHERHDREEGHLGRVPRRPVPAHGAERLHGQVLALAGDQRVRHASSRCGRSRWRTAVDAREGKVLSDAVSRQYPAPLPYPDQHPGLSAPMTSSPASDGPLLPRHDGTREALRFGVRALTHGELRGAAARVAARIGRGARVAVWAVPELETCVAVSGAGGRRARRARSTPRRASASWPTSCATPRPRSSSRRRARRCRPRSPRSGDWRSRCRRAWPTSTRGRRASRTRRRLRGPTSTRRASPTRRSRPSPTSTCRRSRTRRRPPSSSTRPARPGPPKGVVLPRRAIAANLDALADAWAWTADDVLVHGLPLFHVHGLVLGILGPLRRGGSVHHLGRFTAAGRGRGSPAAARCSSASRRCTTGSPRRRGRTRDRRRPARGAPPRVGLGGAAGRRPRADRTRVRAAGGRALRHDGDAHDHRDAGGRGGRPGTVGTPLPGVELRLVSDDGSPLDPAAETDRRDPGARPEPLPRVPEPPGRDGRRLTSTAGSARATWPPGTPTAPCASSAAWPPT